MNNMWQAPMLKQFTPDAARRRRHRLRDRLPLRERHRLGGRLGLPLQGRDVQPGPRLDPRRRQRHVQGRGNFRRNSRPLARVSRRNFADTSPHWQHRDTLMRCGRASGSAGWASLPSWPSRSAGCRITSMARRAWRATSACAASATPCTTPTSSCTREPAPARRAGGALSDDEGNLSRAAVERAARDELGLVKPGEVVYKVNDPQPAPAGAALMLLGFKLRRLLWRARRVTVDLWGAATTVGAAALVGAGWFPDLRASTGRHRPHRRRLRARLARRGQGRRAPARRLPPRSASLATGRRTAAATSSATSSSAPRSSSPPT